ncbi:MAG: LrgB family protein [Alcanivoracaceae bacterium]|nr:LrgB family protein [Alcanivoracaceae bacterium]
MTALVHTPLFGLLLTIGAYRFAVWLYQRSHRFPLIQPLLHPFLVAMIPVITMLTLLGISYREYMDQTRLLQFFLGPATVALAWPLYRQLTHVRAVGGQVLVAVVVGGSLAASIAVGLAWWLDAPADVLGSLAPKSITTPIALEVVKLTGGIAPLAAGAVAITGIVGVMMAPVVFRLLKITDDRVRGLTLGIVAHAIGTSRAFEFSERAGAFSSLALGLTGLFTAMALPMIWPWVAELLTK